MFKKLKIENYIVITVAIITLIIGLVNYFTAINISSSPETPSLFPKKLIIIDLILLLSIIAYIAYKVSVFFKAKEADLFTFKFQTKIIAIIGSLCILPILIITIFSLSFFKLDTELWFNDTTKKSLEESLEISDIYIAEHKESLADDLFNMKKFAEKNSKELLLNPSEFDNSFAGNAAMFSLTEAVIFLYNAEEDNLKILSKTPFSFFSAMEKLDFKNEFKPNDLGYNLIIDNDDNYIRAIAPIETIPNTYILVGKLLNDTVIRHIKNAQAAHKNFNNTQANLDNLKKQFYIVFILIIALIFFAVILLTIYYSAKIFLPIMDIVLATKKVAQGKYNISLDTKNSNKEIATLLKSFNSMVRLIGQKNSDLNMSHQITNSKKEFLETILGSLPSATIVLDISNRVKLFNKSAKNLFSAHNLNNGDMNMICPEILDVIEKLHKSPNNIAQDRVSLKINHQIQTIHILAAIEKSDGEINGYILNFLVLNDSHS